LENAVAGGLNPGLIDDLGGPPIVIDEGTLARTAMPPPGPIGLEVKGGSGKVGSAASGDQVVSFARGRIGQSVGDGQCFALADQALRNAGAKSAADFGTVTSDGDYVWGNRVSLADARAGDIIQFRGYRYDRTIDTATATNTDFQERPHHTAIVERIDGQGAITVLEQNVPDGSPVQRSQLFFSNINTSSGGRTRTISGARPILVLSPAASLTSSDAIEDGGILAQPETHALIRVGLNLRSLAEDLLLMDRINSLSPSRCYPWL
jgi:CHAP domain